MHFTGVLGTSAWAGEYVTRVYNTLKCTSHWMHVTLNARHIECTSHWVHVALKARHIACTLHWMHVTLNAQHIECTTHWMHDTLKCRSHWNARHIECTSHWKHVTLNARHIECTSHWMHVTLKAPHIESTSHWKYEHKKLNKRCLVLKVWVHRFEYTKLSTQSWTHSVKTQSWEHKVEFTNLKSQSWAHNFEYAKLSTQMATTQSWGHKVEYTKLSPQSWSVQESVNESMRDRYINVCRHANNHNISVMLGGWWKTNVESLGCGFSGPVSPYFTTEHLTFQLQLQRTVFSVDRRNGRSRVLLTGPTSEVNTFDDRNSLRESGGDYLPYGPSPPIGLPLSVNLNCYATTVASHVELPLCRSVLPESWPFEVTTLGRGRREEERVKGVRSWRGKWRHRRVTLSRCDTGEWLMTGFVPVAPITPGRSWLQLYNNEC